MKLLSMTATFGKLDHKTLELQPGLNVIEAPNEWGKSTWCAFLVAMLYGISTASRTKKDFLADKERYAPWSGKPMTGRMELIWQGKRITLERGPKGKIPFGDFRAYETDSQVPIPALTGENCGQVLLGVEREVFVRAGFLRGTQLPVGEDEALRRRLNALVTTGDESEAGDLLAQRLKKLKNDCRHNKTGLIPQAESRRNLLQSKLEQLRQLKDQARQLQAQEQAQTEYMEQLKNHQAVLAYEKAAQSQALAERAEEALAVAEAALARTQERCQDLPARQTAEQELSRLQQLQQQLLQLQTQDDSLQPSANHSGIPDCFAGKTPYEALRQAETDRAAYKKLCKPIWLIWLCLSLLALAAGAVLYFTDKLFGLPCLALAAVLPVVMCLTRSRRNKKRQAIEDRYGNRNPDSWIAWAQQYADDQQTVSDRQKRLAERKHSLQQTLQLLTGGKPLEEALGYWQQVLERWQDRDEAEEKLIQAQTHAQTVRALALTAPKPQQEDLLTLSQTQTEQALQQTIASRAQLHQRLGQCQGQMDALGQKEMLEQELAQVQARLEKLEDYNAALTLALETLTQAATQLQRRFAPRISKRAKELFGRLTDGRYDRLLLASDLSMEVAAADEDLPHGVLWRSDGTADQLYLALRLAVAEELTPDAPLVLDDAFVRFDDTRLQAAVEILKEYAHNKQVILFTCQTREHKFAE